jgi:small subunit ribosomal protein S1
MDAETQMPAPRSVKELATGMELKGTVKRIELYGAFVDIGVGQDGLLHISQLGKSNVRNVEDVVKTGDQITVYVLKVEPEAGRIALSLVRPPAVSWDDLTEGKIVTGKVIRLEKFGVFVDIGAERPGMIHVSELASGYVNSPSDVVKVGDEIKAQIIKVNRKKRRIDMSLKAMEEPTHVQQPEEEDERVPTVMELALRRAMEGKGEEAPARSASNKRDKRHKRSDDELEDILARTLRHHSH